MNNPTTGWCLIPPYIMSREDLTITQKVICRRIIGLTEKKGFCNASNEWLGKQIGLEKGTVSNIISQLVKKGIFKVTVIRGENNRIKQRRIYQTIFTQKLIPINVQMDTPIHVKMEESISIKSNTFTKVNDKTSFGNSLVNFSLEEFKAHWGYPPTDKKPRFVANTLVKNIRKTLAEMQKQTSDESCKAAIKAFFAWVSQEDEKGMIQNLDTVRRKLPVYKSKVLRIHA